MNTEEKKKVIRKYLRRKSLFGADAREQALLEDNIDIARWAKNMEFLKAKEASFTYFAKEEAAREEVDPLVVRIGDAALLSLPLMFRGEEHHWFIAGYPDVINYFMPPYHPAYYDPAHSELTEEQKEGKTIYRKLIESLTEEPEPTEFLIYLKRFYKDKLKKSFSLAADKPCRNSGGGDIQ